MQIINSRNFRPLTPLFAAKKRVRQSTPGTGIVQPLHITRAPNAKGLIRTYDHTTMFRDFNGLLVLANQLNTDPAFQDDQKHTIHVFAAPYKKDPLLVYALFTAMQRRFPEKFADIYDRFPIQAYEVNDEIVQASTKGYTILHPSDAANLQLNLGIKIEELICVENGSESYIDPRIDNRIPLSKKNILDFAREVKPDQSAMVVFFRNGWYQLTYDEQVELTQNLSKNLPPKSLVVVGNMETSPDPGSYSYHQKTGINPNDNRPFWAPCDLLQKAKFHPLGKTSSMLDYTEVWQKN